LRVPRWLRAQTRAPPVVLQDIEFFLDPSTVHGEFRKETINKEK
jgi:hypothetical protein